MSKDRYGQNHLSQAETYFQDIPRQFPEDTTVDIGPSCTEDQIIELENNWFNNRYVIPGSFLRGPGSSSLVIVLEDSLNVGSGSPQWQQVESQLITPVRRTVRNNISLASRKMLCSPDILKQNDPRFDYMRIIGSLIAGTTISIPINTGGVNREKNASDLTGLISEAQKTLRETFRSSVSLLLDNIANVVEDSYVELLRENLETKFRARLEEIGCPIDDDVWRRVTARVIAGTAPIIPRLIKNLQGVKQQLFTSLGQITNAVEEIVLEQIKTSRQLVGSTVCPNKFEAPILDPEDALRIRTILRGLFLVPDEGFTIFQNSTTEIIPPSSQLNLTFAPDLSCGALGITPVFGRAPCTASQTLILEQTYFDQQRGSLFVKLEQTFGLPVGDAQFDSVIALVNDIRPTIRQWISEISQCTGCNQNITSQYRDKLDYSKLALSVALQRGDIPVGFQTDRAHGIKGIAQGVNVFLDPFFGDPTIITNFIKSINIESSLNIFDNFLDRLTGQAQTPDAEGFEQFQKACSGNLLVLNPSGSAGPEIAINAYNFVSSMVNAIAPYSGMSLVIKALAGQFVVLSAIAAKAGIPTALVESVGGAIGLAKLVVFTAQADDVIDFDGVLPLLRTAKNEASIGKKRIFDLFQNRLGENLILDIRAANEAGKPFATTGDISNLVQASVDFMVGLMAEQLSASVCQGVREGEAVQGAIDKALDQVIADFETKKTV